MGLCLNLDITERKIDEQRQQELERHKRDFYRRTIMAATQGKLSITDKSEIATLVGPPLKSWEICKGQDLSVIRNEASQIAEEQGLNEMRLFDFVLAIGEATTNAYKHADGGTGSIHKASDSLFFVVSDQGRGIDALVLPELALVKGYTTADSLGMGYKAMIAIADRVFLATGPDGTTIAFEMRLKPQQNTAKPFYLPDTWVQ